MVVPVDKVVDVDALQDEAAACMSFRRKVQGIQVAPAATGSREHNALDKLLRCQCKALVKQGDGSCEGALKRYAECHRSVMSVGAFEGRQDCAQEMDLLLNETLR